MLLVELGGWSPGRQRSPARPSSPACCWSSSSSGGWSTRAAAIAELELGGWPPGRRLATRSAAIAGTAELAGLARGRARAPAAGHQVGGDRRPAGAWSSSAARHQVGGWPPGRRLATRSAAIAGAAELAGLRVVELELGGWSPGRQRSPARSSSAAGHQFGDDRRRGRARRHARGLARARQLVTRSAAITGAAEHRPDPVQSSGLGSSDMLRLSRMTLEAVNRPCRDTPRPRA